MSLTHFKVNLRSDACHLDVQNISKNRLCSKVCGGVCIFKIIRMHSFTGALKTRVLFFQKSFQTKRR